MIFDNDLLNEPIESSVNGSFGTNRSIDDLARQGKNLHIKPVSQKTSRELLAGSIPFSLYSSSLELGYSRAPTYR